MEVTNIFNKFCRTAEERTAEDFDKAPCEQHYSWSVFDIWIFRYSKLCCSWTPKSQFYLLATVFILLLCVFLIKDMEDFSNDTCSDCRVAYHSSVSLMSRRKEGLGWLEKGIHCGSLISVIMPRISANEIRHSWHRNVNIFN